MPKRLSIPHDEIVSRFRSGESAAAIAAAIGCTRQAIYHVLAEAGASPGERRSKLSDLEIEAAYRSGERVRSIARRAGIQVASVYQTLERLGIPRRAWRPEDSRHLSVYVSQDGKKMLRRIMKETGKRPGILVDQALRLLHERHERRKEKRGGEKKSATS